VVTKGADLNLNLDCPMVHRHLCAAYLDLVRVAREARLDEFADETSTRGWLRGCRTATPQ
jgi:hypothetical protein